MTCPVAASIRASNLKPLEDRFPFFVLLILLVSHLVFPADNRPTFDAENVCNGVHTRHHHPIFVRARSDIHSLTEEISLPVSAVKRLKDYVVRKSKMSSTVLAAIDLSFKSGYKQPPHLSSSSDNQRKKEQTKTVKFKENNRSGYPRKLMNSSYMIWVGQILGLTVSDVNVRKRKENG
nr:hypothetical protein C2845_PM05G00080 [Ipomoea batatas]GME14108.1 hypothetical protein C2845_PM05G00080 [Ipomoea batatas]